MGQAIYVASRFPRTWKTLSAAHKERIIEIILALPGLLKNPHRHSGIRIDAGDCVFDVLNHDQIRSMLRR